MTELQDKKVFIQHLINKCLTEKRLCLSALRLDELHPIISGNKWFKLKYYLADAKKRNIKTISTIGGAYSNHIVAAAYAATLNGYKSTGIIRGERSNNLSATLLQAEEFGMKLIFVSRDEFNQPLILKEKYTDTDCYWINEGGYGILGAAGASEILNWIDESYTHIICACGTGTMMAGLIKAAKPNQHIIGISALKGYDHSNEINELLTEEEQQKKFTLFTEYHFGGYAKHPTLLIEFMKLVWQQYQLPTDIVYTSKLLYGVFDLIKKDYFPTDSKIMIIHSGGLQGNRSLPANSLPF